MRRSLLIKHYQRNTSFKRGNNIEKCNDISSLKYWKFVQLLELCSALEKLLSCRWTHSLKNSVYSASIDLSYAIGFGNKFANSFPIIEQFLRVITNIANNYYESNPNTFDNVEECLLATLAISIYTLASEDEIPFAYLYDFYLLPGNINLTMYDVDILLKDTIKYNQINNKEKKATNIKIRETSDDMIGFKKARLKALESSNQSDDDDDDNTIYSKEDFKRFLSLKIPPLHHYSFLIERFEISIFGKSAWKVVKTMNKNSRNLNDSNKLFDQVITELLNDFFHYMKRIEKKMQS